MGSVLNYSGLATKMRAMEAKLLTPTQFSDLATLNSVPDFVNYLKDKTSYAEALDKIDEAHMHRGDIEKIFTLSLYDDFSKIHRFSGLEVHRYLKLYLRHYEVELINYCFRIVINHYQQPFDINYKKPFFDQYSEISIEKLITSRSSDQLIENLAGSAYYDVLKVLKDKENVSLFDYDLALTLYAFSAAWQARHKIYDANLRQSFVREWGTKIDLLNLEWIIRAKKFYQMNPIDIYSIIIPNHYRIPTETMKSIVDAPDVEDCLKAIETTKYGKFFKENQKDGATISLEGLYAEILQQLYRSNRRKDPYSIACVSEYLYLKEDEIHRLTTCMECIRYSLDPNQTLAYIGGGNP